MCEWFTLVPVLNYMDVNVCTAHTSSCFKLCGCECVVQGLFDPVHVEGSLVWLRLCSAVCKSM